MFAGVVSSVLAGATQTLLLSFILPVSLPGPVSSIPDRLAGWGMASALSLLAIAFLWPAPARDPVRTDAIAACRALADRLRAEVAMVMGGGADADAEHERAVAASEGAVKNEAARTLDDAAELLERPERSPETLHATLGRLRAGLAELERTTTTSPHDGAAMATPGHARQVVSSLNPSFRAQELSFVVSQIAANVDAAAAAEHRTWVQRLLGRAPRGFPAAVSAVQERAGAHLERHSVWLQNSLRGAIGLGLAVLIADLSSVQHSFWVVLGALSVLRSNALSTGQNVLRGLGGTLVGFIVGGTLVAVIGTDEGVLWVLLPVAVLLAGLAPAAVSFGAGQAAFTLTILIIFNILQPAGWSLGLVRIEDVALGCAVSLVVGLLLWPRGAGAALGRALSQAYRDSAAYLAGAVAFGVGRCDAAGPARPEPTTEALRAAASSRRLDDTFRGYLGERGSKPMALAEVTSLVTGVAGLRLAGDAVLDLWRSDGGQGGDRRAAREELGSRTDEMTGWYMDFAMSLVDAGRVPDPLSADEVADGRLVDAVTNDLRDADGSASATAVKMIWTGDHLDAARRLQATLVEPARSAAHALAVD